MPGSPSSQDLVPQSGPQTDRTTRSVDYDQNRHSHSGMNMNATGVNALPPKLPSPATTLNKIVSSGSLSTHSGYLLPPQLAPVYGADRASQHSESPSAMSPRTNPGSDTGGYVPQQQYQNSQLYHPTVPDAVPPPGSDVYPAAAATASVGNGTIGTGMLHLPPLPLPPRMTNANSNPMLAMPQQYHTQQYHYHPQHQHQHQYLRGYGTAGAGSSNVSEDGNSYNAGGNYHNNVPRSASWAQLHPSTSYGSLDHLAQVQYSQYAAAQQHQQQQYNSMNRQPGSVGAFPLSPPVDSMDFTGANRFSYDGFMSGGTNRGPTLPPLPAGQVNALNWQQKQNFPPSDKIATLGPGATEVVWALGLGNRVVAVSDCCDYPSEVASRAKAARCLSPASILTTTGGSSSQGSSVHSPMKATGSGFNSSPGSSANLQALSLGGSAASKDRSLCLNKLFHGPFRVEDQVLARERPGLIIYEDEEPAPLPIAEGKEDTFGGTAQRSYSLGTAHSIGTNDSTPSEPLSPEHPEQAQQPGALGRAVYDAVMAVGLQTSCRVLCLRRSTLADVLSGILAVGEAAGIGDEAVRAVDRLRARLRRVGVESARAAASSLTTYAMRPRVLVLRSLQPLVAEGRWAADMVMLAGGEFGLTQSGDPPRTLTWSEIVEFAPEVLVIAGMRDGSGPRTFHDLCAVAALPGWWLIPAVKSGAVFVCEEALVRRGGPRLVEGCEALARMVHGDGVSVCCPPRAVMKLSLRPGQRCRPRLLPTYFMAYC